VSVSVHKYDTLVFVSVAMHPSQYMSVYYM